MAAKGFDGPAGKKFDALVRALKAEPESANTAEYDTWRETTLSRATALFRMVGRKAVEANLPAQHAARLTKLLGETAEAARTAASAVTS